MGFYTEKLPWHVVLLLMFTHSSFAGSCKNVTYACLNDGECVLDQCVCASGYSGSTCSNSSSSVIVLVVVCILPLITWSIVCCYGCSTLRKSKARRRLRQLQLENRARCHDADDSIPLHDDPPCYDQAVYSNPIAISGLDENPDWNLQGDDALTPPPHYDDLKFIHKHLMDLGDGVRVEDGSSTSPLGSEVIPDADTNDQTTSLESTSHSSCPVSTGTSQPKLVSDTLSVVNEQEFVPSGIDDEVMDENEGVKDETDDINETSLPSIEDDNVSATEVVTVNQSLDKRALLPTKMTQDNVNDTYF